MTISIIIQQLKFSKLPFRSFLNYFFPVEDKNARARASFPKLKKILVA